MNNLAIVIPVYKSEISCFEIESLESFFTKLRIHDFYLLTYQDLDISIYKRIASKFNIRLGLVFFPKKYFVSLYSYSKLLESKNFYLKFERYDFILISQLDAFVFKEDVLSWINKGYSFIGAPWIYLKENGYEFRGVGNGGLSLRKVRDHIRVLSWFFFIPRIIINFSSHFNRKLTLRLFLYVLIDRICKKDFKGLYSIFSNYKGYEDTFWGLEIPKYFPFYKVPSEIVALSFSFELNPDLCYVLNKNELPFGCHARDKYGVEFWKDFIK